jgi:hypothetical protein
MQTETELSRQECIELGLPLRCRVDGDLIAWGLPLLDLSEEKLDAVQEVLGTKAA